MSKRGTTSGPITIKGTREDDSIRIGVGRYIYSDTDQRRGFLIEGGAGDDFLEGGIGVDRINGGAGFDDIYAQKEDLLGAAGAGRLAYDGGSELDLIRFEKWTEDVGIDLGFNDNPNSQDRFMTGFSLVREGVNISLQGATTYVGLTTNIEGVIGGHGNDYIVGTETGNYLEGGPGNDYIVGRRGNDQLVGGQGDDFIAIYGSDLVSGDYTDTVPVTFPPGAKGNDIFSVGGGDVGAYYVSRITDFDTRTAADDLQFDQLYINSNFVGRFSFDQGSQTLKFIWSGEGVGDLGEIVLDGLTEADIPKVPVVYWDPGTGLPI